MPKIRTCFETTIGGTVIKLEQRGKDSFRTTYGLEVSDLLDYTRAASNLGSAIMHALACEGKLDNREKGER